jgi:hypothetical protein
MIDSILRKERNYLMALMIAFLSTIAYAPSGVVEAPRARIEPLSNRFFDQDTTRLLDLNNARDLDQFFKSRNTMFKSSILEFDLNSVVNLEGASLTEYKAGQTYNQWRQSQEFEAEALLKASMDTSLSPEIRSQKIKAALEKYREIETADEKHLIQAKEKGNKKGARDWEIAYLRGSKGNAPIGGDGATTPVGVAATASEHAAGERTRDAAKSGDFDSQVSLALNGVPGAREANPLDKVVRDAAATYFKKKGRAPNEEQRWEFDDALELLAHLKGELTDPKNKEILDKYNGTDHVRDLVNSVAANAFKKGAPTSDLQMLTGLVKKYLVARQAKAGAPNGDEGAAFVIRRALGGFSNINAGKTAITENIKALRKGTTPKDALLEWVELDPHLQGMMIKDPKLMQLWLSDPDGPNGFIARLNSMPKNAKLAEAIKNFKISHDATAEEKLTKAERFRQMCEHCELEACSI